MNDHFARLAQPHRPWLDPEQLKKRFQEMAAAEHPDAASSDVEHFAGLNTAYGVLREPASRLHHLLQLQHPAALATNPSIPDDLADCFLAVAQQQRALREFAPPDESSAALVRAMANRRRTTIEGEARATLAMLENKYEEALGALRDLDLHWHLGDEAVIRQAVLLQARLAYLSRWISNIREMLLQLTMR